MRPSTLLDGWLVVVVFLAGMGNSIVFAQEIEKLAEEVQNPLSDLVRVGFANEPTFGIRFNNRRSNVCNLQANTTQKWEMPHKGMPILVSDPHTS
ncbi:MAG: hypothetical protein AB7P17_08325 [Nitrospirales bacterium]|nr:hypothetical protein [Nitrospirales bacterium]